MNEKRKKILARLEEMGITFEMIVHPAVHTIEEMEQLKLAEMEAIPKNLFLRDDKKQQYYLVMLYKDKRADLKRLREILRSRPLSFASEGDLLEILNLSKGEVTPLGILHDAEHKVQVIMDKDLLEFARIGVHPCGNTATVFLRPEDLKRVIEENGNRMEEIEIL